MSSGTSSDDTTEGGSTGASSTGAGSTGGSSTGAGSTGGGSTGAAVASATAGISLLYVLRLVVGFLAQPLIAHNLGLRWQADAYAVSTDTVTRIWLVFEKVVNPAFLPNFIQALKEEGEERAWRFASTAILLMVGALLVVTPLAWFAMPTLVGWLSQKSSPMQVQLTISLARALLTGLGFLGMSSLTYVILNGYKRFVYAALGDTLWKLGVLAGAATAVLRYGKRISKLAASAHGLKHLSGANLTLAMALAEKSLWLITAGFVAGSVLKLVPHLWALKEKRHLFRFRVDLNDPLVRRMFALCVPLLLGIVVSEGRGFYLQRLADSPSITIEAGRAALKWSRIINDNLIQIFPYALSIGIFPYLADQARERDRQPMTETLMGALRACFFTFGPLTAILLAVSLPLLRAVWEGGQLHRQDAVAMTPLFVAYALGLIGFACEMILNQTFYAMTRAWTPTVVGLATTALWIATAKYGIWAGWGLVAIAGSESLAKSIKCIVMWFMLRPHLGSIDWRAHWVFLLKVVAGSIVAAAVSWAAISVLAPHHGGSLHKVRLLLEVSAAGIAGLAGYVVAASAMQVKEARDVLNFLLRLRARAG